MSTDRSDAMRNAVVKALDAGRVADDSIAALANDFAVFVAARTDAERTAALAKLEADRAKAELARQNANTALQQLERTSVTTTTTSSTTRRSVATTTTTTTARPTSTTTPPRSGPSSTTTSTTRVVPVSIPCVSRSQPGCA